MAPESSNTAPKPEMKKPSHDAARRPSDDDQHHREPHFHISDNGLTLTISDGRDGRALVSQEGYEERLRQEADMMVSLESIRAAINKLDDDMDQLEACLEDNLQAENWNYNQLQEENGCQIFENDLSLRF